MIGGLLMGLLCIWLEVCFHVYFNLSLSSCENPYGLSLCMTYCVLLILSIILGVRLDEIVSHYLWRKK